MTQNLKKQSVLTLFDDLDDDQNFALSYDMVDADTNLGDEKFSLANVVLMTIIYTISSGILQQYMPEALDHFANQADNNVSDE